MKYKLALFVFFTFCKADIFFSQQSFNFSNTLYYDLNQAKQDSTLALKDFDNDFKQFRFFISGEYHGFTENVDAYMTLLSILNKKYEVRQLLFELPNSFEEYINIFFLDGNFEKLENNIGRINKVYTKLFRRIYEFNRLLAINKKLFARCIDVEENYNIPIKVISEKLTMEEIKSIKFTELSHIKSIEFKSKDRVMVAKNFISYFTQNKEFIKSQIDSLKFKQICSLVEGIKIGSESSFGKKIGRTETPESKTRDSIFLISRENFMFDMISNIAKEYPTEKFFGQFGKAHTKLETITNDNYVSNWKCITAMISENNVTLGKVCSIDLFYSLFSKSEVKRMFFTHNNNFNFRQFFKTMCLINIYSNSIFSTNEKNAHFLLII
ncbi:MAG: hypothetical protein HYU67_08700 [Flavobacteriia bacterium]|nr:hypothetical protein [Flavobacteriia bacterium]